MAIITVLLGGILGCVGFLTALLVFDYGLLSAFGVYLGIGGAAAGLVILDGLSPERHATPTMRPA